MAIKIGKGVKTFGASLFDGILSFSIGSQSYTMKVPVLQNYGFQMNEHDNPDVFCLLVNDKTKLVLRKDGTGSIMNASDNALLKNFAVSIPKELLNPLIVAGGAVIYHEVRKASLVTTCIIKETNTGVISFNDYAESFVFDIRDGHEYITDLSLQLGVAYPTLLYKEGTLGRLVSEWKQDEEPKVLYYIPGNVITHTSIGVLY